MDFGKNGMTRNPHGFRAMYYTYACVARENGREWKRVVGFPADKLLGESSSFFFFFRFGWKFPVGES